MLRGWLRVARPALTFYTFLTKVILSIVSDKTKPYNIIVKKLSGVEQQLLEFGLTEIEAQMYLHLLHNPPQTVLALSKTLDIPRTSIYDNSQKLVEKGLIERVVEYKSQKLKAKPIDTFDQIIEEQKQKTAYLDTALKTLRQNLTILTRQQTSTQIRQYQGTKGLQQAFWNLSDSTNEIVGYTTFEFLLIMEKEFIVRFAKEIQRKKIAQRLIMTHTNESLGRAKQYQALFEQKKLIQPHIRVIEEKDFDLQSETFFTNEVQTIFLYRGKSVEGVEIENDDLIKTQKTLFDVLWKTANELPK